MECDTLIINIKTNKTTRVGDQSIYFYEVESDTEHPETLTTSFSGGFHVNGKV